MNVAPVSNCFAKLPALQRSAPDKLLSAALAYRILEIDGVDAKAKRQFLEDLTMRDSDFLVDEFDRVDCGVDTTIEIECPVNMETWREGIFQLCWQQHGGSGLVVTLDDALELPTTDRDWLIERIGQQRAREAKELEKPAKKR